MRLNLKALELSLLQCVEAEKTGSSTQNEECLKKKIIAFKLTRDKLDNELSLENDKSRTFGRKVEQLKASVAEAVEKARQEEAAKTWSAIEEAVQKVCSEEVACLAAQREALRQEAVEEFKDSSEYEKLMRVQHGFLRVMIKKVQHRHPNLDTAFLA